MPSLRGLTMDFLEVNLDISDFEDFVEYEAYLQTLVVSQFVPDLNKGKAYEVLYDFLDRVAKEEIEHSTKDYLRAIELAAIQTQPTDSLH